ncbi:MAG: HEPN domain-containing protein [Nanoarchaeota archaeon]|nr:HEPN domain-containing protein [Nanoarchaeota archaeon]MBU4087003.1 HEPN domain-containing protein [Nanoarchaeota archaeon]
MENKKKDFVLIEAGKWLNKAEGDLKHAFSSVELKDYDWAQNAAQQSAEKALKAVCIFCGMGLIKTHELSVLAKRLKAPNKILEKTGLLSSFYSASRYPDAQELFDAQLNEDAATDAVNSAEEILRWCKDQIKI